MNTRLPLLLLLGAALLSSCSWMPSKSRDDEAEAARALAAARKPAPRTVAADGTPLGRVDGVEIEKVAFRAGVSSATVENLAKQRGCTGGWGAGLVSEPGPVEIYRMTCEGGKVFIAKCELRQCKPM
jgi:hypothetical protein